MGISKEKWQDPAFKEMMKQKIKEGREKAKLNREIKKDMVMENEKK